MRIAVIHHSNDTSNDYAAYVSTLLDNTAAENNYTVKDYHQVSLTKEHLTDENLLLHIVIPATGGFLLKYWYSVKLPSVFKKYNINKALCLYGIATNAAIEQLILFHDIFLLQPNKKMLPWQQFAAKRLKKSTATVQHVITYSHHAKELFENANGANPQKTILLPYTVSEAFKPLEWHDKLYIKSRFAENKEFFVAVLPGDDEKTFTELLKAFSKFKKWQQSSMQLILLPKEEGFSAAIEEKLDSYKYKDDVKLVNEADKKETADLMASAYALLHIAGSDADLLAVTAALQSATPVIAFYTESLYEYCGDAGILIKEPGYEALGNELIQLYKNETLRGSMSEAAAKKSELFQQKKHAENLWQLLNA
ncbi:MAG: glycosyltransferase [Panacibacter sp.]